MDPLALPFRRTSPPRSRRRPGRPPVALGLVVAMLALGLGPAALAHAFRGGVASALEVAPLLALGDLLGTAARATSGRAACVRRAAALLRDPCGCAPGGATRAVPLVAAGLAVGWPIALGRALVARALARNGGAGPGACDGRATRIRGGTRDGGAAASARLVEVALCGSGATALATLLGSPVPGSASSPSGLAVALACEAAAGALLGVLLPCTLGAIASAAALRSVRPAFAYGMLATAGVVTLPRRAPHPRADVADGRDRTIRDHALLVALCVLGAAGRGDGLVTPRLAPLFVVGAAAATLRLVRALRAGHRHAGRGLVGRGPGPLGSARAASLRVVRAVAVGVAAVVLLALARAADDVPGTRSAPVADIGETIAPGDDVALVGRLERTPAGEVRVVRWEITCCLADAHPRAARLAVAVDAVARAAGSWVRVEGRAARDGRGVLVDVTHVTRIAAPDDPYTYA